MKGLYVYGALTMALTFASGLHLGSPVVMSLALAAALTAAACEACVELYDALEYQCPRAIGGSLGFLSWFLTGAGALLAIVLMVGA